MKKFLSILIISAMTFVLLAGCGSSANSNNNTTDVTATDGGIVTDEISITDGIVDVEPTTITLACSYGETELVGLVMSYFADQVQEISNGAITLDIYWGGTLCSANENLSFVANGTAGMCPLGQSNAVEVLPLLNFPSLIAGGQEASQAYAKYLVFENEETSALIQAQAEAQNIKMLSVFAGGGNGFCAKKEITSIDDLKGLKIGTFFNIDAFTNMGLTVVAMMPPDGYDNLSKSVVDAAAMAFSAMVNMKWNEVAPYFLVTTCYNSGPYISINLDLWNNLSDEAKDILQTAAENAADYSCELVISTTEEATQTVIDAGGTVNYLEGDDVNSFSSVVFKYNADTSRSYGESAGCSDEMETVLRTAAEYLNYEID